MKFAGISLIVCAIASLLGSLTPMGTTGNFSHFVSVSNLGGGAYILFVLPLSLLTLGILILHGKILSIKAWVVPFGLIGVFLSGLSGLVACLRLENAGISEDQIYFGVGFYLTFLPYLWVTLSPWFYSRLSGNKNPSA